MRILGLLLLLAATLLAGCARNVTWKEEVKLSDGRVIVVERETVRVPGGDDLAYGGSGSRPKERRIRIPNPDGSGKIIEWHSTKTDANYWPENPLVLDVVGDEVVVMSAVPVSPACDVYLKYAFRNGVWIEERLQEEFTSIKTNLLLMSGPDMPSFVDLENKASDIADIRYPRRLKQVGPHRTFCHG